MNALKKKIILVALTAIMGGALFYINMLQQFSSSTGTAFAAGLAAASIAKLIQLVRISRDPKRLKKYEMQQKEERFILIAEKSGRFAFIFTILAELAAIFILLLLKQDMIVTIVSTIIGLQMIAYLLCYVYLCRKI